MMQATRVKEQRGRSDSANQGETKSQHATLASRYGRIGISAVAAAVSQKAEKKPHKATHSNHALRYERE